MNVDLYSRASLWGILQACCKQLQEAPEDRQPLVMPVREVVIPGREAVMCGAHVHARDPPLMTACGR